MTNTAQTVDPKTEIVVTLTAEEWNIVLDCMADGRFRVVAPLVQKIVAQAQQPQAAGAAAAEPARLRPVPESA